jgi:hypothetical protein
MLSSEQVAFYREKGYLAVPGVVGASASRPRWAFCGA